MPSSSRSPTSSCCASLPADEEVEDGGRKRRVTVGNLIHSSIASLDGYIAEEFGASESDGPSSTSVAIR